MSAILSQNKQIGENEQISETSTSTSLTTVRNSEHSATFNNIHVLSLSGQPLKYSCIWYMCQSYLVKQNVKNIHKGTNKSIVGHNDLSFNIRPTALPIMNEKKILQKSIPVYQFCLKCVRSQLMTAFMYCENSLSMNVLPLP